MRHLKETGNRKYCKDEIIKKTYGFDYKNFRFMLIRLLGLITVEKLERQVDAGKHGAMRGVLGALKTVRDAEAHTHLKGTIRTLNAPSYTIGQFQPVFDGLVDLDRRVRKRKSR